MESLMPGEARVLDRARDCQTRRVTAFDPPRLMDTRIFAMLAT
jgi:hypothetical protein